MPTPILLRHAMNSAMKTALLSLAFATVLATPALGQLAPYAQDFEGMSQFDSDALSNDGWLVFGNVFDAPGTTFLYPYGPFPAPNNIFGGAAFSLVSAAPDALGTLGLVVFSDYQNGDHGNGLLIESNVFQEQTIVAADVGMTYRFQFDAKKGNLAGASTALAFIKTLDPGAGPGLTNFLSVDTTSLPTAWGTYTIELFIDPSLVGQILQFGFLNKAKNYEPSGVFYDNVSFQPQPVCPCFSLADLFPQPLGFCYDRHAFTLNAFAFSPGTFAQVTSSYCRLNGLFRPVTAPERDACDAQLHGWADFQGKTCF